MSYAPYPQETINNYQPFTHILTPSQHNKPLCKSGDRNPVSIRDINELTGLPIYFKLCDTCINKKINLNYSQQCAIKDRQRYGVPVDSFKCKCGLLCGNCGTTSSLPVMPIFYSKCVRCLYLEYPNTDL